MEMEEENLSGQTHVIIGPSGVVARVEYGDGVKVKRPPGGKWVPVDDPVLIEKLNRAASAD